MAVEWNGPQVLERVRQVVAQGVLRAAESVRTEAINLILDTPKTGRLYVRRTVTHQASAPGEPPASDTGTLVNRINVKPNLTKLSATVEANTAYAAYLEFGTARMAERPFMRPALAARRGQIEADIAAAVRAALA